jgi:signal transduction histidine kinase
MLLKSGRQAGVPPAILAQIFNPFFARNPGMGTGLGLALC